MSNNKSNTSNRTSNSSKRVSSTQGSSSSSNQKTRNRKATEQGKRQNSKRNKKKATRKARKVKRGFVLASLSALLIISLTCLAIALVFYFKYGRELTNYQLAAKEMVDNSTKETFRQAETSLVYDIDGNLISVLKGEKDVYYVTIDKIPELVKSAMISIEDKKFKSHVGVDLKANIRAVLALVKNKGEVTQGASTITQQLARNIFLTHEVSFERKFKEIFLAMELERKYSKDQILEFYLNNIYFANGYYGIEAASRGYFGKGVSDLSLGEITFLCAVPNNPTIYNPRTNKDNTIKRSERILYQMLQDGVITSDEYEAAKGEKIKLKKQTLEKQNYVETFVFYSATRALMEKEGFQFVNQFSSKAEEEEYTERYNELYNKIQRSLYYGGYRIYTSIDMKKQEQLQDSVDEVLKEFTDVGSDGIYELQSGAVSIDNKTGRVLAIVGGRYQDTVGYTLNRAYQSFRQPGSAIKPLIVYTPAFEKGYYPDDIVVDEKFKDGPSNANNVYSGEITIEKAVEVSKNTIAWKIFEELTPKVGLSYLLNMNFTKIDKNDYYPAASLGGFTVGVSPLEITSAYAALANDGLYREPTCIIEIKDSNGNVLVDSELAEKRVYESNASRMMTSVLQTVMKSGTGKNLNLKNMVSAGKTGTTNDKKDGWFVGYTPYYTTGVWVGYDSPKQLDSLSGASYPGRIWKDYMTVIHEGLEKLNFTPYKDREKEEIPSPTPSPTEIPTEAPIEIPDMDGDLDANPDDEDEETPNQETPNDDWNEGEDGDNGDIEVPDEGVIIIPPTNTPTPLPTPIISDSNDEEDNKEDGWSDEVTFPGDDNDYNNFTDPIVGP